MLRAIILLVATLAAFALAAPAPLPAVKRSSDESFGKKLHSFKSFTHGHRGRKHNPVAELSRIANKFHWSLSLPFGSITVDLPNGTTDSYGFPDDGSASSPSSGSDGSSSDGTSSGDNSSDDGYGSSGSGEASPDDGGYGSSGGGDGSLGDGVESSSIQTSITTTAPTATYGAPSYATDDPEDAESTNVNIFTSSRAFSTRVSTTASAAATASASASTGGGDGDNGEVNAHPEENESEYLSPVTIGGQKLNLNFDTGSADLWVFSTALPSEERGQHSVFDPSKSSTWEEYEGANWEISYGDGSGASGTVGYDQVDVGGVTATKQAVEIATAISSAFASDENNDGLLGLAFGKINTIQPRAQKTFFENVADDLEEKVFTADLDIDASGTYEFGKLDTTKYSGELHTTPIDETRGWWEFESAAYSIGGKDVQNSNASPAIADTGTSLVMVDDDIAEAYYSQIDGASMSSKAGGYVYPCDADVPSFGVEIGSSGFMAHINGSDIEYAKVGSNTCFGGIQGNGGQGLQIFGAVLLKQYFAVFDFGEMTFGLAEKA